MKQTEGSKLTVKLKTGRSLDPSDPGIEIPGHSMYWVAARSTENKLGRVWKLLRKEDLSRETIKHIESRRPEAFQNGENTIRWGSNVLAYAPIEVVKQLRLDNAKRAQDQTDLIKKGSTNSKFVKVDQKETEVERVGANDFNT